MLQITNKINSFFIFDIFINDYCFPIYLHSFQFLGRLAHFGKSTVISTLKELYSHGVKDFIDENGVKQESYFKGLAIEKLWDEEKTYKIIYINFSSLPNVDKLIEDRFAQSNFIKVMYKNPQLAYAIEKFRLGFAQKIKEYFTYYNLDHSN